MNRSSRFHLPSLVTVAIGSFLLILALRYWPSDRWLYLALVAYFPAPLLLAGAILVLVLSWKSASVLKRVAAIVLVFLMALQVAVENRRMLFFDPDTAVSGIRVFQWNVWSRRRGIERICAEIVRQNPHVICINEPKRGTETVIPDYRKHLSRKWYECSQGNLLILSRYRLQKEAWLRGTAVVGLQTRVDSNPPLSVLLIDVSPEADFSRVKVFQSLVAAISKQPELPDLILGDFNTPAGAYSIHRVLQLGYKDSYLVAGSGWGYTWNAWLPLMRIDMALARDSLQIVRHQSSFTSLSDHAWQWVDIRR